MKGLNIDGDEAVKFAIDGCREVKFCRFDNVTEEGRNIAQKEIIRIGKAEHVLRCRSRPQIPRSGGTKSRRIRHANDLDGWISRLHPIRCALATIIINDNNFRKSGLHHKRQRLLEMGKPVLACGDEGDHGARAISVSYRWWWGRGCGSSRCKVQVNLRLRRGINSVL